MISPRLITHNFWLKFFSIALATVIWLGIHYGIRNEFSVGNLPLSNQFAQEYVRVPVSIICAPRDNRVFRINPTQVVVIAMGEKNALHVATQRNVHAYVNLTNFRARQSPAEEITADVPPDITVLDVYPSTVSVEQVSP
jgi:hypothetical protein